MTKIVRLTVEQEAIDRLKVMELALQTLGEVGPCSVELRELVRSVPQGPAALNLYFAVAGIAGNQRVALEPCDFESHLVAAMRALNGKRH